MQPDQSDPQSVVQSPGPAQTSQDPMLAPTAAPEQEALSAASEAPPGDGGNPSNNVAEALNDPQYARVESPSAHSHNVTVAIIATVIIVVILAVLAVYAYHKG